MTLWDLLKPLTDVLSGTKPARAVSKKPARPKAITKPAKPAVTKPALSKPSKLGPAAMANAGATTRTAPTISATKRRPPARKRKVQPSVAPPLVAPVSRPVSGGSSTTGQETGATQSKAPALSMEERYEAMTREMLATYNVRVRKWRTSMSGIAWYVTYRDGHVQKLIESPKPKGPMSAAIFLHEIGHHAIGFNVYKPRCLEEYHAWMFSLREMERFGFTISEGVQRRVFRSLRYAVAKAQRRGIREVPAELTPYIPTPARNRI